MAEQGQAVFIELSNGKTAQFTGRAVVFPENAGNIAITNIKFGKPFDLPPGYSFETLPTGHSNEENNGKK
jgi:hypothetical protein